MDLNDSVVREICPCAQYRKERGDDAIYCKDAKGKDPEFNGIQFINLQRGEVCVATTFFSTGHRNYDSNVNLEEMKECPYRILINPQLPNTQSLKK